MDTSLSLQTVSQLLGTSGDSTIAGAVKSAKAHGKVIVVDTIGVKDRVKRAQEAIAGGVNLSSVTAVKESGVTVAVAGAAIYGIEDPAKAVKELEELLLA